jgi:hypothetical protein
LYNNLEEFKNMLACFFVVFVFAVIEVNARRLGSGMSMMVEMVSE